MKYHSFQASDFYQRWDDKFRNQDASHKTILLGDSITAGLRGHTESLTFDSVNWGISGDTSKLLLNRVNKYHFSGSNAVHLMIGTNDLGRNTSIKDIIVNIDSIIHLFQEKSINVYLYKVLYTDGVSRRNSDISLLNQEIELLSNKRNIILVDLNKSLSNDNKLIDEYSYDGLHLNKLGYEVWLKELNTLSQKNTTLQPIN
ncbi:GDSL-type esterase/lipase family protein [Vibrio sp. TRT 21S02]|uniref:GDSL-type esterase/lipase family protein n=1 Tax=Vibrio sp. TRT 21S02 TaxID=3418507 RepID=UPI003CF4EDDC